MKLHLGCGERYIPGFYHVDAVARPHVDHVGIISRLPMSNESASLIYCCHVIEHFLRVDTLKVLEEWNRVLRPGGILRIATVNFTAICEVFQKYHNIDLVIGPLYGRQNYLYNFHRNCFTFKSLEKYLRDACFKDIRLWDWRKTEHAAVDDYSQAYIPHMDKENGIHISLNVEATK
jgi:predicted SAM-dependent methyltransferase